MNSPRCISGHQAVFSPKSEQKLTMKEQQRGFNDYTEGIQTQDRVDIEELMQNKNYNYEQVITYLSNKANDLLVVNSKLESENQLLRQDYNLMYQKLQQMQPYSESLQTTYNTNYPVVVETYKLRVKQLEEQLKIARHKIRHYKRLGSSHQRFDMSSSIISDKLKDCLSEQTSKINQIQSMLANSIDSFNTSRKTLKGQRSGRLKNSTLKKSRVARMPINRR